MFVDLLNPFKLKRSYFSFRPPSPPVWIIITDCFNIGTTVYISTQVTHISLRCHLIVVQHGPRCDSMKTVDTAHQFDWRFNKWLSFSLPISPNRSRTSALNHCPVRCDWWRHITDTFPMYVCKCVSVCIPCMTMAVFVWCYIGYVLSWCWKTRGGNYLFVILEWVFISLTRYLLSNFQDSLKCSFHASQSTGDFKCMTPHGQNGGRQVQW